MDSQAREWLIARAIEEAPFEACGFILEGGQVVEVTNVAQQPSRNFRMDREELAEKLKDTKEFITGIWHTHPRGNPDPSHTDLNAIKIGAIQRNWDYYIVTSAGVFQYDTKLYCAPEDLNFWNKFSKAM